MTGYGVCFRQSRGTDDVADEAGSPASFEHTLNICMSCDIVYTV